MLNKSGFTLLEVLIALVVFAIVSVGVYTLLNQSLFMENYAKDRLNLILASTEYIYINWDAPPEETIGFKEIETGDIDAFKVEKTPLGFQDIVRVDWFFRKNDTTIGYVFYY